MSPLDMLIFFFLILVTIKAVSTSIDYWKDVDDELAAEKAAKRPVRTTATLSRTIRTGRPASVRVTPIKRVDMPTKVSASRDYQYHLKEKGVA